MPKENTLKIKLYLAVLSVFLLSACSQRFQHVNDTFSEAVFGADDVIMSAEHIRKLPYASIYAKIDDGAQIFMVLAFADTNPVTGITQYKWMSSDNALIVTEGGRIVKTLGLFGDNLRGVSKDNITPTSWTVMYDWMPNYQYGYRATLRQSLGKKSVVTTPTANYQTQQYIEEITFDALDVSIRNSYWRDVSTERVVRSIEYIGPNMTKIELTMLKFPTI